MFKKKINENWPEKKKVAVSKIICMLRDDGFDTAQIGLIAESIQEIVPHISCVAAEYKAYSPKLEK